MFETLILNANMTNIKQVFGPEKLSGLSRNGPLVAIVFFKVPFFISKGTKIRRLTMKARPFTRQTSNDQEISLETAGKIINNLYFVRTVILVVENGNHCLTTSQRSHSLEFHDHGIERLKSTPSCRC